MKNQEKYLKLEDLKDGNFYYCRLSKKEVLLNYNTKDLEGNPTSYVISYYSDVTGYYQIHHPVDYQLAEI